MKLSRDDGIDCRRGRLKFKMSHCKAVTFLAFDHLMRDNTKPSGERIAMEKATFAAGCFWGVEATFRQMPGVSATRVGYTGGQIENPTYKEVCTDRTGHAEAVEVEFDPAQVRYADLLKVFWENHDPTQVNRQGPDWGSQYRSAIFYHSPEQAREAQASKESLERAHRYSKPTATQIVPAVTFFPVEDSVHWVYVPVILMRSSSGSR